VWDGGAGSASLAMAVTNARLWENDKGHILTNGVGGSAIGATTVLFVVKAIQSVHETLLFTGDANERVMVVTVYDGL
jgi:hypothetical protein